MIVRKFQTGTLSPQGTRRSSSLCEEEEARLELDVEGGAIPFATLLADGCAAAVGVDAAAEEGAFGVVMMAEVVPGAAAGAWSGEAAAARRWPQESDPHPQLHLGEPVCGTVCVLW